MEGLYTLLVIVTCFCLVSLTEVFGVLCTVRLFDAVYYYYNS